MSELKTRVSDSNIGAFLAALTDDTKRQDSLVLLDLFKKATGEPPRLWGDSIVGFGFYMQSVEDMKRTYPGP
jgi:hypothetical protein